MSKKCNWVHHLLVAEDIEPPRQPLKGKNILYDHNVPRKTFRLEYKNVPNDKFNFLVPARITRSQHI
jgi:hypothetical protein